jgi:anti-sigma regulatory factor (Ser/Thr protein kinase)
LEDLSLHILDIAENSIAAGAAKIEIAIDEDTRRNLLLLRITDDGKGLDEETRQKVLDPFYTTRQTRRVGLGLPLLAQAAREAEGDISVQSQEGKGTTVTATFVHDHIDRKPLGNIADTLIALIAAKGPDIDIVYEHRRNGGGFLLDTHDIKEELQDVPIDNPGVLKYLKETITSGLKELENEKETGRKIK